MRPTTRSGEPSRVSGRFRAIRWRCGPAAYAARLAGNQRAGFTLVELLVAMSIIVLLAGLTVAFLPSAMEQQRATDGATQLQRWLSVAQQRARRDQAGRGLRLIAGSTVNSTEPVPNPLHVTNCQYLEQPDDFFIQTGYISALTGTTVSFATTAGNLDFYNGQGAGDYTLWAVQPGDYLEVNGGGVVHMIPLATTPTQVVVPNSSNPTISNKLVLTPILITTGVGTAAIGTTPATITLANVANISLGCYLDLDSGAQTVQVVKIVNNVVTVSGAGPGIAGSHTVQSHGIASYGPGTTFRVIRAPRVTGDEVLEFPPNVVVDLATNNMYDPSIQLPLSNGATGNLDIMFAPNGAATAPQISKGILALWVRDLTAGPNANGAAEFQLGPTIIAIYLRTGLVAAHPPNPPPAANVYSFLTGGGAQ